MQVEVRLYSILRERDGKTVNRLTLELPAGAKVRDVLAQLQIPPNLDVVLAIGETIVDPGTSLHEGDTLALIPAISGGSEVLSE